MAQQNKGIRRMVIPAPRIFRIVVIKLAAPITDDKPARCRLNIAKSTETPGCPKSPDKGGYAVHPVATPPSITLESINSEKDGGKSQKLKLFIRGKAMSGAPNCNGNNQFPNPPISIGITIKKIITNACAVTKTL